MFVCLFVWRNGSEGSRSGEGLVRGHTGPRGERIGQGQVQGNWKSGDTPGIGSSPSGWRGAEGRMSIRVKVAPESQAVTVPQPGQWPLGWIRMKQAERRAACSPCLPFLLASFSRKEWRPGLPLAQGTYRQPPVILPLQVEPPSCLGNGGLNHRATVEGPPPLDG